MGKWLPRDRNAKNYGELGSNPHRKSNGRKRGVKGRRQRKNRSKA
jgi:hypothetical protein